MGVLGNGEYTLREFGTVSSIIGGRDECGKYINEHGGTLYTQADCGEYADEGEKESRCYVEGDVLVNRTGVYGVA